MSDCIDLLLSGCMPVKFCEIWHSDAGYKFLCTCLRKDSGCKALGLEGSGLTSKQSETRPPPPPDTQCGVETVCMHRPFTQEAERPDIDMPTKIHANADRADQSAGHPKIRSSISVQERNAPQASNPRKVRR